MLVQVQTEMQEILFKILANYDVINATHSKLFLGKVWD